MKKKEKIHANSSSALYTAKCTALARDKLLMKVEKALKFWVQDTNRTPLYYTGAFIIPLIFVMSYCA